DAVAAEITVLAEQLREVEVVDCGVEHRDLALIAERDVDVVPARLERLDEVAAKVVRFPLEDEPGVETGNRHAAIQMLVRRVRILQVVARQVESGLLGAEPRIAGPVPVTAW